MRQIFEHDPVVGHRFAPDRRLRKLHEGGGYLIRTNDRGFRSERPFVPARDGRRRVLVFGDSFTAGDGVSNPQRWSDRLEAVLPDTEMYNFGLPGTGTDQHFLAHRLHAADLERDLVVVAVYVENLRRVAARYRWFVDEDGRDVLYAKPWFQLVDDELVLRGVPVPAGPVDPSSLGEEDRAFVASPVRYDKLKSTFTKLRSSRAFERVVVSSGLVDRALELTRYQPVPEYDDPQHRGWLVLRQLLVEWGREAGAPLVIIPVPIRHHIAGLADASAYRARFAGAATAAGATLVDPLDALAAHTPREIETFFFPHDGHFTAEGHRAFAAAVAPGIASALGVSHTSPEHSA